MANLHTRYKPVVTWDSHLLRDHNNWIMAFSPSVPAQGLKVPFFSGERERGGGVTHGYWENEVMCAKLALSISVQRVLNYFQFFFFCKCVCLI